MRYFTIKTTYKDGVSNEGQRLKYILHKIFIQSWCSRCLQTLWGKWSQLEFLQARTVLFQTNCMNTNVIKLSFFFFFLRSFEFFSICRNGKRLGFLNIISWSRYLKGLLGLYKPKIRFSELIWGSLHIATLALNSEPKRIDIKTKQNLANRETFSNTLCIYLQLQGVLQV